MKRLLLPTSMLAVVLGACAADAPPVASDAPDPSPDTVGWTAEPPPDVLASRRVFQPQLFVAEDGVLLAVWREPGQKGSNLYLSRRPPGGAFGDAVLVNDDPDSVSSWNHDENRAAVALGSGGRIAVAWTTGRGDVRAAVSADHGATFVPSLKLNQDEGLAYHGFPTVALDAEGGLHAAWIDARDADRPGAEEPADLYYARVVDGTLRERNLTADREDSVCGCCRLDMEMAAGQRLTIAFRNATVDGYRDIFRLTGTADGTFSAAERLGPPMWKLDGCPSAGPITAGGVTLWNEGSTGRRRTLAAAVADGTYSVVLESGDGWSVRLPPRRVAGSDPDDPLVLVPGSPNGKIMRGGDGAWSGVAEDLPEWASSAAVSEGRLVLFGAEKGEARLASGAFGESRL